MPDPRAVELGRQLALCRIADSPLDRFNSVVLRAPRLSPAQLEVGHAFLAEGVRSVAAPAGHMVGKTTLARVVVLYLLLMHEGCYVVTTGPSYEQLRDVLWTEIEAARAGSPLLRGLGTFSKDKLRYWLGPRWGCMGLNPAKLESVQGRHRPDVFLVVDEASGVSAPMFQTLSSLNPQRTLLLSNPLANHGHFFDQAMAGYSGADPSLRTVRLPSTGSPHAHLERSPCGLADATWIARQLTDYGRAAYLVRVEGYFPGGGSDALVEDAWWAHCRLPHARSGPVRIGIDLAKGTGGDDTTVVPRDDNGVLPDWSSSNREGFEATATRVALLAQKYDVPPQRITYDVLGLGMDFGNRLAAVGLPGCMAYNSEARCKNQFADLRAATAFALRWRLDPTRRVGGKDQHPFHLPPDFLAGRAPRKYGLLREVAESGHRVVAGGKIDLRPAKEVKAALRGSFDYLVGLSSTWAFPST